VDYNYIVLDMVCIVQDIHVSYFPSIDLKLQTRTVGHDENAGRREHTWNRHTKQSI